MRKTLQRVEGAAAANSVRMERDISGVIARSVRV